MSGPLKTLVSQISDPHKFRRLNGILTVFWLLMIPISAAAGLLSSVSYIAFLSLYALFVSHLGAWAASRAEVQQVETAEIQAENAEIQANNVTTKEG